MPVSQYLHSLPVEYRIIFRILLYTYKGLIGLDLQYITDLLTPYAPSRTLRSGQQMVLVGIKKATGPKLIKTAPLKSATGAIIKGKGKQMER